MRLVYLRIITIYFFAMSFCKGCSYKGYLVAFLVRHVYTERFTFNGTTFVCKLASALYGNAQSNIMHCMSLPRDYQQIRAILREILPTELALLLQVHLFANIF